MPDNKITAEVSVGDGVATAKIRLSEQREHTETVPLHPRYPDGAPEDFMALDSLRAALSTVEKESYPSLYDLQKTREDAQRAKELGLYQEPQPERHRQEYGITRGGGRGGGRQLTAQQVQQAAAELSRAVLDNVDRPTSADSLMMRGTASVTDVARMVRESTANHDNMTTAYRRDAFLDGFTHVDVARPVSPEPRPIITDQRLTNGRHIITPSGTYQVVKFQSNFLVDPARTPEGPSDERIRTELARRIANELAGRISVSRVVRSDYTHFDYIREYRAELTILERRDG